METNLKYDVKQSSSLQINAILDFFLNTYFLKTAQHRGMQFALFCLTRNPLCTEVGYQIY